MFAPASKLHSSVPPLRTDDQPDGDDGRRVQYVKALWHGQDVPLRARDRQIEENVRMLCGQQYTVYNRMLGRFIDALELLPESERRWRHRPAFNRLLFWFVLTHSRLTENPPIISFLPSTGDRMDAELAEVLDPIFKSLWLDTEMAEVLDRLVAWMIPGGRAHTKSRIDMNRGTLREWRGDGTLPLLGPDGQPMQQDGMPIEAFAQGIPFDRQGNPLARLLEDMSWEQTGDPFATNEGGIVVDVLSPLEVRGEWSPAPWHRKGWHIHRAIMTPEDVYETWGVEVTPDIRGSEAAAVGEMQRLLTGTGFYGATGGNWLDADVSMTHGEFVSVYELWKRPCSYPGMERSQQQPGGRQLVVAGNTVLRDGQRPADFRYTSPIRCYDFIGLPARPSGTSPQEAMNPVQRSYNRMYGAIMEHVALSTNPKALIDSRSGIEEGQWTNAPGEALIVTKIPGVAAVEYVSPDPLGADVYKLHGMLSKELSDMGYLEGVDNRPPGTDPSGEFMEQMRFNSDRYLGATARRMPVEIARQTYDWIALLRVLWDAEKTISWAGEDQMVRTITVLPHLFEQGNVNVVPDVESMIPESRGQRQARVDGLFMRGVFGDPASPEARLHYLEQARFPHMSRAVRPGGVHRITAEQENGQLLRGAMAAQLPIFPWYDHAIHLAVLEQFMSSPEFVKLAPEIQGEFFLHWQGHKRQLAVQLAQQAMEAQAMAVAAGGVPEGAGALLPAGGASREPKDPTAGNARSKTDRPFNSPKDRA